MSKRIKSNPIPNSLSTRFKSNHEFVGEKGNLNFKKGMIPWNKKDDVFITCVECGLVKKIKPVLESITKCCSKACADKHKDQGKTTEAKRIRTSTKYSIWRSSVFERDNFTCNFCGKQGGKLNADHIKPFAFFPELRLNIDNGRTLCEACHRTTDNFGGKGRRKPILIPA